jgi:hypothetical protein
VAVEAVHPDGVLGGQRIDPATVRELAAQS